NGGVAPDFGVECGTAGVKNSYDLPVSTTEVHGVPDSKRYLGLAVVRADDQSVVRSRGVFANDQLGETRLDHAAFGDFNRSANSQHIGRNAPDLSVSVGSIGD